MCIYVHIFIMHMLAGVWYMHQNVHAYVHMLRHPNFVTYTHKEHMCIHMDVFIHVYIYILAYVYVKTWTC